MLIDLEELDSLLVSESTLQKISYATTNANNANYDYCMLQESLSKEHILFIKIFLIEHSRLELGLLGRRLEQKIAMVRNTDELKSCIATWHMAMRDSRNGGSITDTLMEKLAHLMRSSPLALASERAS